MRFVRKRKMTIYWKNLDFLEVFMKSTGTSVSIRKNVSDDWKTICEAVAATFRFSDEETKRLVNSKVARLIGVLPIIAGCEDAERTALAHLSIYLTAARGGKAWFNHRKSDDADIYSRLRLGASFIGGDKKIIERGMDLLAMVMLSGYNRDKAMDLEAGKYNPLNDGAWNFEQLSTRLQNKLEATPCLKLDAVMTPEESILSIWT